MSKEFEEIVLKKLEKLNVLKEKINDTNKVNNQKHDFYEQNISSLNAKVFNYDLRISNLEDKVLIA